MYQVVNLFCLCLFDVIFICTFLINAIYRWNSPTTSGCLSCPSQIGSQLFQVCQRLRHGDKPNRNPPGRPFTQCRRWRRNLYLVYLRRRTWIYDGNQLFWYLSFWLTFWSTLITHLFPGPFLLTHLLIDLLKRSAPSRIVIVSSLLYKAWPCTRENLETRAIPFFQYCKSKCALIRKTIELAKRLEGTGTSVNCLQPGTINTGIYRNVGFPASLYISFMKFCMKTVEEGILTSMYCVTAEELTGVSGKYFSDCKESSVTKKYKDSIVNKDLWDTTRKIVQLSSSDPQIWSGNLSFIVYFSIVLWV